MKGFCPECEELVDISPTAEKKHIGWSAEWWRVDMHKQPDPEDGSAPAVCEGSGRLV